MLDGAGNIIANPAPTALCTAITSFASQLDTMIGTAAGANKLNL
ncbi:MAG TPA: hypothetical protein VJ891_11275 [Casimicrobiaceae bacterium]|nr:hypothetical protein [Casimicrobiaceae bacterium]